MIQINQELCIGCGQCKKDVFPTGFPWKTEKPPFPKSVFTAGTAPPSVLWGQSPTRTMTWRMWRITVKIRSP